MLVSSSSVASFTHDWQVGHSPGALITRPNRVRFRYGPYVCSTGHQQHSLAAARFATC